MNYLEKCIEDVYLYLSYKYKISNNTSHVITTKREFIDYLITTQYLDLPPSIIEKLNYVLRTENMNNLINITTNSTQINLYKGDITQLNIECIVNATNFDGLGCFSYKHPCIDNTIHLKAGPELRKQCKSILGNNKIITGETIITNGHCLPCKYIMHTVGPVYYKYLEESCKKQLSRCYESCLDICKINNIKRIAFCCISTGVYGFPNELACEIAVNTVKKYLQQNPCDIKIIFCAFTDKDYILYKSRLGIN